MYLKRKNKTIIIVIIIIITNASQVCGRDGLAAMLAAKRSAAVTPEVNLMECVM